MKLMTMKQYMKMSTTALMRKINKELRAMPKVKLARLCYNITKSKLPRLSSIDPSLHTPKARKAREARVNKALRQLQQDEKKYGVIKFREALPYNGRIDKRRKKKRKFSRKQLAAQRLFAKRSKAGTLRKRRR